MYLAEQGQLDVDALNLLGFRNWRGTDSVCPTTSTVRSPAEMPCLMFSARLYHGIEATRCQAERRFSALAHLIGDLRSRILTSKVERNGFHSPEQALDWRGPRIGRCCRAGTSYGSQECTDIHGGAGGEVEYVGWSYRTDTTNGHVDRISRLPALVQSFLVLFFLVCFVGVLGVILRYQCHSIFLVFCFS